MDEKRPSTGGDSAIENARVAEVTVEKFDARLVRFPGWENIVGWKATRPYQLPEQIFFEADFTVTRHTLDMVKV